MKKAQHFSSHLPVLWWALEHTGGDVLEFDAGLFSTPFLHYYCVPRGRLLVTVESDRKWMDAVRSFEHECHTLLADIQPVDGWSVVFIDHAPPEQRRIDLLKYANLSRFIVVHDTNGRQEKHYHLREVWSQFKYVRHYGKFFPQTTIVTNFEPIGEIC